MELFKDFKAHAEKLHKDIKSLENDYSCPAIFFGTTERNVSANSFIKHELQNMKHIHGHLMELSAEVGESINDNAELFRQDKLVNEDLRCITAELEKHGFIFSFENENSPECTKNECQNCPDNVQLERAKGNENENDLIIRSPINAEERNDVYDIETGNEFRLEENVKKYLEDNNIELEDIVTPYLPRMSVHRNEQLK